MCGKITVRLLRKWRLRSDRFVAGILGVGAALEGEHRRAARGGERPQ
jgi:hypothetical protein